MSDEPVFLYIATYDGPEGARQDYEAVKELHKQELIGTYDAAIVTKDEHGKVHVDKHEKPTQHGAWGGLAAGAVLGLLFPPGILVGAAAGGLIGGLIGHFWKGMSRKDVLELGEFIDDGEAALVVVGESALRAYVERAITHSSKQIGREIEMDRKAFEAALKDAARESTGATG
jgi:uncharacterized membrane protein